jgi:asparagine synthase (glutamine-hydrolysing)
MREPSKKTQTTEVNFEELSHILTLRYYPKGPSSLPKLAWQDFVEYPGIESAIRPLIEGAIRSAIDFQKPKVVGVAISGGVDSTSVTALTRKLYPELNIKTICVTFGEDVKEATDAQNVADIFNTDHHHLPIENPIQDLPEMISITKKPRWNAYTYYFFKHIRPADILLTGDGGDELFGGYAFRYQQIMKEKTLSPQTYLNTHRMDWVPDQPEMFGDKAKFSWERIYSSISDHFRNPLDKLGQTFLADYNGKLLYDFGPTNGAFTEYFKIPTVAPMLSNEVIFTASHLRHNLKYDNKNNVAKILLRQILMENFAYKSAVKPKTGFGMDRFEMWNKNKDLTNNLLDKSRSVELGVIRKEWLDKTLRRIDTLEEETKLRYITKMFMILALEVWLRLFVTHEMKPSDKLR